MQSLHVLAIFFLSDDKNQLTLIKIDYINKQVEGLINHRLTLMNTMSTKQGPVSPNLNPESHQFQTCLKNESQKGGLKFEPQEYKKF